MNLKKTKEIVKQEESSKATTQHAMAHPSMEVNTLCHEWVDVPNPKKGKEGENSHKNNGPNRVNN